MNTPSKDVPIEPPKISPEEGGVDGSKQTLGSLDQGNITIATYRPSPFGEQLSQLSEDGSNWFGGKIGTQLTVAAYRQLEEQNHTLKNDLNRKDERITELSDSVSNLKVQLAVSSISNEQNTKAGWLMSAIYAIAAILISLGVSDFGTNSGKIVFGMGCVCFVLGFLSPFVFRKVKNDD